MSQGIRPSLAQLADSHTAEVPTSEARRKPAIGVDELTGDPAPFVRDKEGNDRCDIGRGSQSTKRMLRDQGGAKFVVDPPCVDRTGVDHVGRDPLGAEFAGGRDHNAIESALRGAVGKVSRGVVARECDNRTPGVGHLPRERRDQQEAGTCVDGNVGVKTRGGGVENSRFDVMRVAQDERINGSAFFADGRDQLVGSCRGR